MKKPVNSDKWSVIRKIRSIRRPLFSTSHSPLFTNHSFFFLRRQWLISTFILLTAVIILTLWTLLLPLSEAHGAYTIQKSLRFNDDDSAYLSKTPAGAGNRKTFTWSGWVKRGSAFGSAQDIFSAYTDASNFSILSIDTGNAIQYYNLVGAAGQGWLTSAGVLRDPSAWYHVVVSIDATTSFGRVYINGVDQTSTLVTIANVNQTINNTSAHNIGRRGDATTYFDGHLSDVYFIDGQALGPESFAETDSTTGTWKAKAYSGTYGTNGYHLDFTDSSTLGNDVSGNNNDYTSNNLDATDQMRDTPTNNYATLSPIDRGAGASLVTAQGNLSFGNSSAAANNIRSTFTMKTGKWYWEMRADTASASLAPTGLSMVSQEGVLTANTGPRLITTVYICSCGSNFTQYTLEGVNQVVGTPGVGAIAINDTFQVAYDADTGKLWYGVNNAWMDASAGTTGNPSTGANPMFTIATGYNMSPAILNFGGNFSGTFNFGQGGQAGLTYSSAAGGSFKYAPPQGFKALSTANLPTPAITKPSNYFDAKTYTGSGTATSTWSGFLNFQPSLTWLKDRTSAVLHGLFDAVRKTYPYLSSNATTAETSSITALTAFESDGFALGSNSLFNTNTNNYISWNWKEDPAAGFDIVTYTGNGSNRTISHSLGKTPDFIIVKVRTISSGPAIYHASNTSAPETDYLRLDSTNATVDDNTYWNDTKPTASVFSLGTNADVNSNGNDYVAYLFASTTGYSKFGSYTGNGSTDGPFVYTGFKPRYLMIKRTSDTNHWYIRDTARDSYNPAGKILSANGTGAEGSPYPIDMLANGFKIRDTDTNWNGSGSTYIYVAFAENPFKEQSSPYNLTIASSTRFNDDDSAYLSRTPGGAGNRKTFTYSGWIKRGNLTTAQWLWGAGPVSTDYTLIRFGSGGASNDDLEYVRVVASAIDGQKVASGVFRDPSAWYHIVVSQDAANAIARMYVNGVEVSYSTNDNPSNVNGAENNTGIHAIGRYADASASFFDGYMSDVYLIDGQALTPSDFGEADANGIWRPKTYSGTYGTNGFHLPLTSTSPGDDTGTNNADWTANNLDATDNIVGSPTNNFATWNVLDRNSNFTTSNGNLQAVSGVASGGQIRSNFQVTSGKWYWEVTLNSTADANMIGVAKDSAPLSGYPGSDSAGWGYYGFDGNKYNSSATAYGSTYGSGDVIGVALDMDTGKVWFSKNSTWQASGDPAAGTNAAFTNLGGFQVTPAIGDASSGSSINMTANFGQGGTTGLTYNSASGGYFKYTPPSGFKAVSTANLPASSITKPNNYFDAKTYTGTGAATSTWSGFLNFQPALVWIKDRTSANAHGIFDAVRQVFPLLSSNATTAETASTTALTNFASNGFTLGASNIFNKSSNNYISWNWLESSTAGFDIVSYTGTGANRTIAHSLGAAPSMMIIKARNSPNGTDRDWYVYHRSLGGTKNLWLNSTAAQQTLSTIWNNTDPTSSVFSLGTENAVNNATGVVGEYVAYLWSEVPGFSKFGSYTGNGSADGPFVYTGFKPRWVMIKRTDSTGDWIIIDTARTPLNTGSGNNLYPNLTNAEETGSGNNFGDFLSNGFKVRNTYANGNASTATYVYAAFAEAPFKYATAGSGLVSNAAPFTFFEF
jgi:hypothetical protein